MEEKNFENVCPKCGNDDPAFITTGKASYFSWKLIALIIVCIIFAEESEGAMSFVFIVAMFGVIFYYENQEKKNKNRYQRYCHKCGTASYYYKYERPNSEQDLNERTTEIATTALNVATKLDSEKATNTVEAIKTGAQWGFLKGEFTNSMRNTFDTIKKISSKVFEKICAENQAQSKPLPDIAEINEDINNYYLNGTKEITKKILPKKYDNWRVGTLEGIAYTLENNLVDFDTMKNILDDYEKICKEFLKSDLIEYVGEKYDVWLAFDLNDEVVYNGEQSEVVFTK